MALKLLKKANQQGSDICCVKKNKIKLEFLNIILKVICFLK